MIKKENIRPAVDLKYADLYGADLSGDDLSKADLRGVNLSGADLSYGDFRSSDLTGANLTGADLSRADFRGANLSGVKLFGADLSDADLEKANLTGADLSRAVLIDSILKFVDLTGAILTDADLTGAILTDAKGLPPTKCPEKGSYIGYKKAKCWKKDHYVPVIITLEIPEGAKRSSATSNKCRCSEAKVLAIESLDGSKKYKKAVSYYCQTFVYKVGKTVKVVNFHSDRWAECASGIRHFMTRKEAEEY